jgi:hypothetical protein
VSLSDFYALVDDDTAVADAILVALAGGRTFIETRHESHDRKNLPTISTGTNLDKDAFLQIVRREQQDFLWGWGFFFSLIGLAFLGLAFLGLAFLSDQSFAKWG